MSSSPSHATVTYTSMSNDNDVPSWGIPLMDAYEFDPEAPEAAPYWEAASAPPLPPPSPLPRIPSPPLWLPPPTRRDIILEADMPPQKRARFAAPSHRFMTALEEVKESVTDIATRHRQDSEEFYVHQQDVQDDRAVLRARVSTHERERRYHRSMAIATEQEATYARQAWTHSMDYIRELRAGMRI
ncbi:hypothetical protein Tco_1364207, partial [Tanacetum coccineum]